LIQIINISIFSQYFKITKFLKMRKFSLPLKNKKLFFLIFLFFLVFVLVIPKTTSAVNGGPAMENLTEKMQSAADVIAGKTTAPKSDIENAEECAGGKIAWYWRPATGLASLLVWFPKKGAQLTGYILSEVLTKVNSWSITSAGTGAGSGASAAFASGWATTRDLANMLIALGFVIIGIATALRLREYEAKKALWPLIIVALFVNFSGLFCGLLIDGSNLTMNAMLGGNNSTIGITMVDKVNLSTATAICKADEDKKVQAYFANSAVAFFMFSAVALSLLYLSVMLIARYAVLGILFVLSPLAFVFWAFPFPKAKDLFNRWWGSFLKWAFAGVGMCYFLMIANGMLDTFLKNPALSNSTASDFTVAFYFLVVLTTIVVGVFISIKGSGMVGGAVMGIAGGAVGYALGAAKGAGKVALKAGDAATGGKVSSAGRFVSQGAGRYMEKFGLRSQGTTAGTAQKDMKESTERISNMTEDSKTRIASSRGYASTTARKDKLAAIQDKVKNNNLSDLGDTTAQAKAITWAEGEARSRGIDAKDLRKNALKQNPNIAKDRSELMGAVQKQAPAEFAKNIDTKALTPAVLSAMNQQQMSHLANKGSPSKREAVSNLVNTPAGAAEMRSHISALTGAGEHAAAADASNNYRRAQTIF